MGSSNISQSTACCRTRLRLRQILAPYLNVFSEGLLTVNESETLNRSFTIILAVHQPYSIMLHMYT